MDVHDAILEHRIEQTHYSNKHHQPSIKYQINDLVYVSIDKEFNFAAAQGMKTHA